VESVDYVVTPIVLDHMVRAMPVCEATSDCENIRGVFYFAIFMMAFLWRSGATNEPDENSRPSKTVAYGPRVVTTLMFAAGTLYLGLVIVAVRKI
jgi:hypothetical protein